MDFGYIRISDPKKQNIDRQLEGLLEKGIPRENIYIDKQSGKNFDRPAYQEMKSKLTPGSRIFFWEADRFSRNFDEGKEEVDWYMKNGIQLVFLDMEFLNDMLGSNDVIVRLMGYMQVLITLALADKERQKIRKRQREGIAVTKKNRPEAYRGKPTKYTDRNPKMKLALDLYETKKYSVREISKMTGICKTTLYDRFKKLREENEKATQLEQAE